jgi:hypothetical protein
MRLHQRADGEGMLDHRQRAAGVVAPQLEDHADATQLAGTALAWADDGQGWGLGVAHGGLLFPSGYFGEHRCTVGLSTVEPRMSRLE